MATHAEPIQRERREAPGVAGDLQVAAPVSGRQADQQALQQSLDQSPRVSQLRGLQQMLAQSPNVARQNRLAATLAPRGKAPSGLIQAKGHGQAVAGRLPLRATLLGSTSLAPVQRAPWDWLPSIGKLVSVAGAAYAGVKTGAAVGSLAGPWGATIGGAVGGLAGLAGSLYGADRGGVTGASSVAGVSGGMYLGGSLGSKVGGVPGAVLGGLGGALVGGVSGVLGGAAMQDKAPSQPTTRYSAEKVPSLGTVTYRRAVEKAMAEKFEGIEALKRGMKLIDDPDLQRYLSSDEATKWIGQQSESLKKDFPMLIVALTDKYYGEKTKTTAHFGSSKEDQKYAAAVRQVLEKDPFIKMVLEGKLKQAPQAMKGGALSIPEKAPSETQTAADMFNKLVDRKNIPALPAAKRTFGPGSGIMRETGMQLGWASPAGAALHELGHHLEYSLAPSEFATLHNFMRARSKDERRRYVGYEGVTGGRQTETGYDMEMPNLEISRTPSLVGLIGSGLKYPISKDEERAKAASTIDRFIVAQGNKPETSYASQIYEDNYDTEFLSTTIHFFADPELAQQLVRNDPLRVCLFLSFANANVYERIRKQVATDNPQIPDLNKLIHKVAPDDVGLGLGQPGDLKKDQ